MPHGMITIRIYTCWLRLSLAILADAVISRRRYCKSVGAALLM